MLPTPRFQTVCIGMTTGSDRVASISPQIPDAASAVRRIAGYSLDYLVIVAYACALFGFSIALFREVPVRPSSPLVGQLIGFVTLTAPVVLYFAFCEASAWQGTIGKRLLRLRVTDLAGRRATQRRTLLRAGVKFLPWEIAHTCVHQIVYLSQVDPDRGIPVWVQLALVMSLVLPGWYVGSMFIGSRRTPYDRISGTVVVRFGAHR